MTTERRYLHRLEMLHEACQLQILRVAEGLTTYILILRSLFQSFQAQGPNVRRSSCTTVTPTSLVMRYRFGCLLKILNGCFYLV